MLSEELHNQPITGLLNEQELKRLHIIDEKKEKPFFEVAFCGHFSAGKSTIMNTLLGAEILPTSPIPTSANLVSIEQGELGVTVGGSDGETQSWTGDIPWEKIREWGMDGEKISEMSMYAPLPFLGTSIIYDTPGIDSTDPSHQKMTVEALYTTDLIVYVMEYNHVQSETNLHFLRKLSEERKPLILIVNQVDKHDEKEISFEQFNRRVIEGFRAWNIQYLQLFYTSMKKPQDINNEYFEFERKMKAILYHGEQLTYLSNDRMKQSLLLSAKSRLEFDLDELIEQAREHLAEKGFGEDAITDKEVMEERLEQLTLQVDVWEQQFEQEWRHLFEQVTIFPFATTDLTRKWLESKDQSFKVGLFASKKKTELERNSRLEALIKELDDKIKSQLVFHLKKTFEMIERDQIVEKEQLEQEIAQIDIQLTKDFFEEVDIPKHINRDYVFVFTKDREAKIKKILVEKARGVLRFAMEQLQPVREEEIAELTEKQAKFQSVRAIFGEIEEAKEMFALFHKRIALEAEQYEDQDFLKTIDLISNKSFPENLDLTPFIDLSLPSESVIETNWQQDLTSSEEEVPFELSTEKMEQLKSWIQSNHGSRSLEKERKHLQERLRREQNQTFRISLFGAFSAGKSSFANALLGAQVLPVSPHPTTATINTIKRSTAEYAHNQAVLFFKSTENLEQEIRYVGKQLGEELNLDQLLSWRPQLSSYTKSSQKTLAEYLLTLKKSLNQDRSKLNTKEVVTVEGAQAFIAEESKACLIYAVDVYYDCHLTLNGIELVDTPGVNSIFGRHTNVAFTQIKHSDAVFYLTYYNHAFSKADEWFLQQVAKVNEGFHEDKLYFVLNAADLAGNERELNGVKKHVYDELTRNGLQEPRLYHLSSKQGLLYKKGQPSQAGMEFVQFEQQFYQHTIEDLKKLNIRLLIEDVATYQKKVEANLAYIQSDEGFRQRKLEEMKNQVAQLQDFMKKNALSIESAQVQHELEQLLVYLRERLSYVLSDGYISAINVTTLTGKTKRQQQASLMEGIREWKGEAELFLQKELEATFVRIELTVSRAYDNWQNRIAEKIKESFPHFMIEKDDFQFDFKFDFNESFIDMNPSDFLDDFKSPKHFFEEGGTKALKEKLVQIASSKGKDALKQTEMVIAAQLQDVVQVLDKRASEHILKQIAAERDNFDLLFSEVEQGQLVKELKQLQAISLQSLRL
ncbi:dynamin family protein [Alkalihalobacillus pseudalcaliphilus]|uniref:dynamin family protein n=1 Tax=Alkalihalobacillus pseudalcaliphilus TaxID=79884 RepID=UPI00064DA818|nr:dynamin family protein [Alkalihalobacillus pseudalcaliphilus]KMK76402.1 hypothetical protein AB990_14520 [Alkalihalobacillus pseudalcaliphilus]